MVGTTEVFWAGVLPAAIAAAALSLVWKLTHQATAAWLSGLSLGYLVGHWGLDAPGIGFSQAVWKSLNPADARDWLPLAVVAAAVIDGIALIGDKAARCAWILRAGLCAWLPWRLLEGSVYLPKAQLDFGFESQAWSSSDAALWLGSATAIMAILWTSAKFLPRGSLPRMRGTLATLVTLGASATIALSGSLTTGQLLGVLAAAMVGCGIAAAAWRLEIGPEGATGPYFAVFCGVLVIARFLLYEELSLWATATLLLAAYVATGWLGPKKSLSARTQLILRATICIVAIAVCIVPAARDFAASQSQEKSNPYQSYSP